MIYLRIRTRARQIISRFPAPAFYSDYPLACIFSRHFFHTDPIVRELRQFAFSRLENDFGHGTDHARKVSLDAGTLIIAESGKQAYSDSLVRSRMRMAQCAGLLHDIMRKEKDHAAAGADYAREVLKHFPFRTDEIEDISQAIRNHEAFKEISPIHTPDGLLISNCLYDADKFRWGADNFQDTVWDMVIFFKVPFGEFLKRYPIGLEKIAAIRSTFRSDTGKKYGPRFIDTGLAIGKELYAVIQSEFAAFA
ncbi:MAG: HD domain-containing protein [Desulfococcaceae bacterium]